MANSNYYMKKLSYKDKFGAVAEINLPQVNIDMTYLGDATLDRKGIIQLSDVINDDNAKAITPKGVKEALKDYAKNLSELSDVEITNAQNTQLLKFTDGKWVNAFDTSNIESVPQIPSDDDLVTGTLYIEESDAEQPWDNIIPGATLDSKGIVQLSNDISEDETKAATPKALKSLSDRTTGYKIVESLPAEQDMQQGFFYILTGEFKDK